MPRNQGTATYCKTISCSTASSTVDNDLPTPQGKQLLLTNLDAANTVWVSYRPVATVTANGDDCIPVRPGETVVIPNIDQFRTLAVNAAVLLHMWVQP